MKSSYPGADFVVEWSSQSIRGYDRKTGTTKLYSSLADVARAAKEVVVAVSHRSAFVRAMRVPNAAESDVRQMMALRLSEFFPGVGTDVAFDLELTRDVNEQGRLAIVCAMAGPELRKLHLQFRSAGIRVVRVLPLALAAAQAGSKEGALAIIERTPEGLAVDVLLDGVLRVSRVSGPRYNAEAEICRSFQLAGLEMSTVDSFGDGGFEPTRKKLSESSLEALCVHQNTIQQALELPESVAAKRTAEDTRRNRTALLFAASACALAAYAFLEFDDASAKVRQQESKANASLQRLKVRQTGLETQARNLNTLQAELSRGFEPAQKVSDIVTVAGNTMPEGVWLTAVSLERGKTISLRGTALTNDALSKYLAALTDSPRFRDVKLQFATNAEIDEKPVLQFSVSAFPVGNLPLIEPRAKGRRR